MGVVGGVAVVDADQHDTGNATQHERPEDIRDNGNLTAAQRWLNDRMTEVHIDCAQDAENLSAGESAACDRLDEDYPEYLEQYASVEREQTGSTETADAFNETRNQQRELAEETREFNETYEEYQEARDAGDEERARWLARELTNRSQRIEELGGSLNRQFAELENRTGASYDPAQNNTNETVREVRNTTQQVAQESFTPTTITAEVTPSVASFSRPATVSGRLVDENGTQLAGRTVVLIVGNQTVPTATDANGSFEGDDRTIRTETDENGTFEAEYRPVTTTTGPTTVSAVYVPALSEEYLGSSADVEVDVVATGPSLRIQTDADRVAFGDSLAVTADVSAADRSVPAVPVAVFLGDERIATGRTAANGSVSLNGTVPATVADGQRELTVRASREGTALSPVFERRFVTVERTETDLTVNGVVADDALVVTGQLATVDGRPVAGQTVSININGETRETAVTDAQGRYEVRVPGGTDGNGEWTVTADFENPDSNLGPSTASEASGSDGLIDSLLGALSENRILAAALAALVGSILAVLAVWYFVRRNGEDGEVPTVPPAGAGEPTDAAAAEPEATAAAAAGEASTGRIPAEEVLAAARGRLSEGSPSEAIRIGYGAVRGELLRRTGFEGPDTRTHREFYRDVRPELPDSRAAALKTLTDTYERAEFAPAGVDETTAESAVDAAVECLETTPAPDGGTDESADGRGD